jgi:hypothetical protein
MRAVARLCALVVNAGRLSVFLNSWLLCGILKQYLLLKSDKMRGGVVDLRWRGLELLLRLLLRLRGHGQLREDDLSSWFDLAHLDYGLSRRVIPRLLRIEILESREGEGTETGVLLLFH